METRTVLMLLLIAILTVMVHGKGKTFEMDITEKGEEFREEVEIDVEANMEKIVVPTHNDVTGATYLHDFNLNVTVRKLAESGDCYLTDLAELQEEGHIASPNTQLEAMEAAAEPGTGRIRRDADEEEVEDVENSYSVGDPLSDEERQALSPAMKKLCEGKTIRKMQQMHDHVTVKKPGTGNEDSSLLAALRTERRVERWAKCPHYYRKKRCLKRWKNCYYYDRGYYYQTCSKSGYCKSKKTMSHQVDRVLCCKSCCSNRYYADKYKYPYCNYVYSC